MMYLCILFLPFLSFISCACFGRFLGTSGSCFLATFAIILTFLLSLFGFFEIVILGSSCNLLLSSWIVSELLAVEWAFFFDSLSVVMLCVVSGISSLVHLYSTEYMNGDPHQSRFMSYLSLFTGFMLLLVTADNFLVMFFGWEGIGLASFLLISFWQTRIQASKSAIKAMLVNRVGDVGLALGICFSFLTFKTLDYAVTFALVPSVLEKTVVFFSFDLNAITLISLLLFWGVLGKSAQLSLHIWLPDAMEGPTPVSALIHAATLVVSGVFLIIKCSIFFENSDTALIVVGLIGALTAFFAASVGLFQNDLKRVIAYSTCSQLGYMIFVTSLSCYSVSLFHLVNHAVFKALLFLSAGCIIHGLSDEQDLRKMGGLINIFPVSYAMILIGSLALVGTPFLTGFYSKDCILELAFSKYSTLGNFCYFLGCFAACCTCFYSFRLIFLTFINPTNSYKRYIEEAHEAPIKMLVPLMILGVGAICYGFLSRDLMIGLGSLFFNSVFIYPHHFDLIDAEFLPAVVKNIPFFFTLFGGLSSFFLIHCFNINKGTILQIKLSPLCRPVYVFLNKKWFFDQITNELLVIRLMHFGYYSTFQNLDKGLIEKFGSTGLVTVSFNAVFGSVKSNSGHISSVVFAILFSCLAMFTFVFCLNFDISLQLHFLLLFFSFCYLYIL